MIPPCSLLQCDLDPSTHAHATHSNGSNQDHSLKRGHFNPWSGCMDLFPHVYACICRYSPFIDASNLIHFEKGGKKQRVLDLKRLLNVELYPFNVCNFQGSPFRYQLSQVPTRVSRFDQNVLPFIILTSSISIIYIIFNVIIS